MIGRCLIRVSDVERLTSIQISKSCIIVDRLIQVFEVHIFSHQRKQAGKDLFTSYYSLPFLAALFSTLSYLSRNCALLCQSDKGTVKQGPCLSCKHFLMGFWLVLCSLFSFCV